jgi:hypothetical protein
MNHYGIAKNTFYKYRNKAYKWDNKILLIAIPIFNKWHIKRYQKCYVRLKDFYTDVMQIIDSMWLDDIDDMIDV